MEIFFIKEEKHKIPATQHSEEASHYEKEWPGAVVKRGAVGEGSGKEEKYLGKPRKLMWDCLVSRKLAWTVMDRPF